MNEHGIPFEGFRKVPKELRGRNNNKSRWTRILEKSSFAQCPNCSSALTLMTITYKCPTYEFLNVKWEDPRIKLGCKKCGYRVIGTGNLSLQEGGSYLINSFNILEQKKRRSRYVKKDFHVKKGK